MLPLAREERLKADIWERKLKQFGSHSALQKKVSDCNSEPLVWQFVLTDEHWIKMAVTEIQQSCCACASVGVSAHQVGSHPLQALKPLSSECAWGEPPLGGWQQLSCFGSGASPIQLARWHLWTACKIWGGSLSPGTQQMVARLASSAAEGCAATSL